MMWVFKTPCLAEADACEIPVTGLRTVPFDGDRIEVYVADTRIAIHFAATSRTERAIYTPLKSNEN